MNIYTFFNNFKEHNMQDPRQLYLFNDMNFDDMESDDYEEAYFNYLLDNIDDIDNEQEF